MLIRVNEPKPITVKENPEGKPVAVLGKYPPAVTSIEDTWRIDDEWWTRQPISRMYYEVELASGQRLTIFKDLVTKSWYSQRY